MRRLIFAFCVAVGAAVFSSSGATGDLRVVVFERVDCTNCKRLRYEVIIPLLAQQPPVIPLDVVDLDALGTAGHTLAYPVWDVPTLVVMDKGRERARLSGRINAHDFDVLVRKFWRSLPPPRPDPDRVVTYTM